LCVDVVVGGGERERKKKLLNGGRICSEKTMREKRAIHTVSSGISVYLCLS